MILLFAAILVHPTPTRQGIIQEELSPVLKILLNITGAWFFPGYSTDKRLLMLKTQIARYVELCEMGHFAEIYLTAYNNIDTSILDSINTFCSKISDSILLSLYET